MLGFTQILNLICKYVIKREVLILNLEHFKVLHNLDLPAYINHKPNSNWDLKSAYKGENLTERCTNTPALQSQCNSTESPSPFRRSPSGNKPGGLFNPVGLNAQKGHIWVWTTTSSIHPRVPKERPNANCFGRLSSSC